MTVDLKWGDAMVDAAWAFDVAERASGWPESMTPRQLAAMQRLWDRADRKTKARCEALIDAIQKACVAETGQLPHKVTSKLDQRRWSKDIPVRFESMYWDGERGKVRTFHGTSEVEVKTFHIEAKAFADWLRKQGEEPSEHIAHWFKVRGVAAPTVLQLTPLVPAVDDAAKTDEKAPAIPITWAELVAWPGRKEPGFVWTDNLRQIVATEKGRRSALAHTGITAAMGAELGCSARHINDLINGIGKSGSRKQVLDNAMARMGNGTSGKSSS